MTPESLDLTQLPRFLDRLQHRDAESADFARQLLEAGGIVRVFWGPEQMDVWELRVQRGGMIVRFGMERGYADGVLLARVGDTTGWDGLRPIRSAVLAWARANDVPLPLNDPDAFDMNLPVTGLAAVDWVDQGHDAEVERVHQAWKDHHARAGALRRRTRGRPDEPDLRELTAASCAALEKAAQPR